MTIGQIRNSIRHNLINLILAIGLWTSEPNTIIRSDPLKAGRSRVIKASLTRGEIDLGAMAEVEKVDEDGAGGRGVGVA